LPQELEFVFRDSEVTITDSQVRLPAGDIAGAQPERMSISRRGASRRQSP
jgi:hypothetical protein